MRIKVVIAKNVITKETIIGAMRLMGPMGPMRPIGLMRLMGLIALMALVGCTSDTVVVSPAEEGKGTPLGLVGFMSSYESVEKDDAQKSKPLGWTRAVTPWSPPSGYVKPAEHEAIGAFFTKSPSTSDPYRIYYKEEEDKWYLKGVKGSEDELTPGDYQLYGYMPYNAADVSVAPNTDYADGAVVTLNGLKSVMTQDVCVMVGAKDGTDAETVTGLQTGHFGCTMKSGGTGNENYLFMLFDHIYAALSFRFRMDEKYAELRTIHLKQLMLTAYTDNTFTSLKKKNMTATIALKKNDDDLSPIQSISFEDDDESGDMEPITIFTGEEVLGTGDDWTDDIAYVPYTADSYVLRSIYDVYDKQGNLIRQNCAAENMITPLAILNLANLERGKKYILKLTIAPTYLYVLSDPDLDNPTVVVD